MLRVPHFFISPLLIFLSLGLCLTGCASSSGSRNALKINTVDRPLGELREMILQIIPAGQRGISPNGREILSRHFIVEGRGEYKDAGDAIQRYYARFLILGDRRPYNIELLVTREKRVLRGPQFIYVVDGTDTRLAKELERRLREELNRSRKDSNIIDDFRVF